MSSHKEPGISYGSNASRRCIYPVRERTPINIRNTIDPTHPGTTIVADIEGYRNGEIVTE